MGAVSEKQQRVIAELSDQINSPLAVIRNALYLAACRTLDPQVHRYLQLADEEITAIAAILHATRMLLEGAAETANESPLPRMSSQRAAA